MKSILVAAAALMLSFSASANSCKTALSASVSEYQAILADATTDCKNALNATYSNDLAKKLAIAAACGNKIQALESATATKRAACNNSCPADAKSAGKVCDTKIGLSTFFGLVEAL